MLRNSNIAMFILLLIFACLWTSAIGNTISLYSLDKAAEHFEKFIVEHDKHYADEKEKEARFQIFKANLEEVNRLNEQSNKRTSGPKTEFDITQFMDLTREEFVNTYTGLAFSNLTLEETDCSVLTDNDINGSDAPDSYDWREHKAVTRVRSQGKCESCYAFSTVGFLEGQNAIKHNQLVELSEQQIVDCDTRSNGCNRGLMSWALMSIIELGGIMTGADYPYTALKGNCKFDKSKVVVTIDSCNVYNLKSQDKLKQLVYKTGPIAIAVQASNFNLYKRGVFADENCGSKPVDHAVLLVGYGTEPVEGPYWIVKNSYGTRFGESGYIRLQRGKSASSCRILNTYMASALIK